MINILVDIESIVDEENQTLTTKVGAHLHLGGQVCFPDLVAAACAKFFLDNLDNRNLLEYLFEQYHDDMINWLGQVTHLKPLSVISLISAMGINITTEENTYIDTDEVTQDLLHNLAEREESKNNVNGAIEFDIISKILNKKDENLTIDDLLNSLDKPN